MKRVLIATALLASILGTSVRASEVITNGGFSGSPALSGWGTVFGAGGTSGGAAVLDRSTSVLVGGVLYQMISLAANVDYTLTFNATKTGGSGWLSVGLVTSLAGSLPSFFSGSTLLGSTANHTVALDGSTTSIGFNLQNSFTGWLAFVGQVNSFSSNKLLIDNVSIAYENKGGPLPTPGPIAGAGLPLLLGAAALLRRRKVA